MSPLDDIRWPKIAVVSIVCAPVTLVLQGNSSFSLEVFHTCFPGKVRSISTSILFRGWWACLEGLRSSRHRGNPPQEVYSPPHYNSEIIDTVYLPGIGTSCSNISLSMLIDILRRTSHLKFYFLIFFKYLNTAYLHRSRGAIQQPYL